ncbi:MAG TPA: ankyrin repeat domain-containing protein [Chitinophagales bacterium]|nr:ankyrin repeat domain-containing protein [Chitinophagales bacterium]HRG27156.1 ankyrin repeat domain-containing protein [Chitinophagales bacterium]HRH54518.1 ankyrin repeat domain-containing protein [Chitinophagales bacterium]
MARPGRPNKSDLRIDEMKLDIEKGHNEKVKQLLLEVGIDACDDYLRTALIWSTFFNNIHLLNWVINNGANVNHQDKNGYSALHVAAQEKHFDCAQILIDNGSNLELGDLHGNTALWTAVFNSRGDTRLVKLYVQNGANLDHVNKYQRTPRQMAEIIAGFDMTSI